MNRRRNIFREINKFLIGLPYAACFIIGDANFASKSFKTENNLGLEFQTDIHRGFETLFLQIFGDLCEIGQDEATFYAWCLSYYN